jgi:hypothetical protein
MFDREDIRHLGWETVMPGSQGEKIWRLFRYLGLGRMLTRGGMETKNIHPYQRSPIVGANIDRF